MSSAAAVGEEIDSDVSLVVIYSMVVVVVDPEAPVVVGLKDEASLGLDKVYSMVEVVSDIGALYILVGIEELSVYDEDELPTVVINVSEDNSLAVLLAIIVVLPKSIVVDSRLDIVEL